MTEIELVFKNKQGELLVIMPHVLKKLLAHRQFYPNSKEAAGVLIGERRGSHLVVHKISEPGKGDIRRRFFVNRCGAHHQSIVDRAFSSSSGRLQYIGEWHTHPEDTPLPSSTDLNTWRRHLTAEAPMVLLIVGRKQIWAAKKNSGVVTPLQEVC